MFVSNHIKSFNELIRSSIFSLLRRLQDSENPLFVNYFYTDIHFRSHICLNTGPHNNCTFDRLPLFFFTYCFFKAILVLIVLILFTRFTCLQMYVCNLAMYYILCIHMDLFV